MKVYEECQSCHLHKEIFYKRTLSDGKGYCKECFDKDIHIFNIPKEIKGGNKQMETPNNLGKLGVGTKEQAKLKSAKVKIVGYKIDPVNFGDKTSNKVILSCKHPDKADLINISGIVFVYDKGKKKELKNSGIWLQLDEDKMIAKNSALATLLNHLKVSCLDDLTGKEADTELDGSGYLAIKAY